MFKEKIKSLIIKEEAKDSKKKIENIAVLIIVLIITIIAINVIWNGDKKETTEQEQQTTTTGKQLAIEESEEVVEEDNEIGTELENILSKIDGVGKVKVFISYSESSQVVAMYNENSKNSQIEEKDSDGGTRTTTQEDIQKDIIYKEENGEKVPITQKIISPKIEGAIITAEGARKCKCKK